MWGLRISLGGIPCAIFFPKFQACSDRSVQFLHLGWRILPCKQWCHQQRDNLLIPCCPLCRRYKTKTGWVLARNRWALRISLQFRMIFRHQLRPLVFCWTGSLWSMCLSCRGCRRTWVFPGDGYDWLCQRPWKNPLSGHPSAFHFSCFWRRRLGIPIAEFHMIFYPWNHVGAGRGCCSGWHVSWCCLLWCAPSSCMRYMSGKWACGYWVSYSCPSCRPGLHLPFSNRQGYCQSRMVDYHGNSTRQPSNAYRIHLQQGKSSDQICKSMYNESEESWYIPKPFSQWYVTTIFFYVTTICWKSNQVRTREYIWWKDNLSYS